MRVRLNMRLSYILKKDAKKDVKKGNRIAPCCYTEEELDEEIRLSEASGVATDAEVVAMFAKWGLKKTDLILLK